MKKVLSGLTVLSVISFSFAQSLEERVENLEKKIKQLEERVLQLEGKPVIQSKEKEPILLKEGVKPVEYTMIQKKFHKGENKLYDRDDKILLVFNFTSNFKKDVDVLYGNLKIYDKSGNELLTQPIKVYKPLDFIRSNKIKPGETFRRTIEIIYETDKPNLKYIKDAPVEDLKIEIQFNKVEFSDGSVEFLN
ncbi:hypothetical protein [Sulfurihydrogenibium sp.]|uniref:hypothetical protein n=1 Tax=Sulfurihydrogenibium sp. TaxID=2053621 RepID=UPI002610D65C|nr:hypothetical protein [Sulfurihydrogenibium sp.]